MAKRNKNPFKTSQLLDWMCERFRPFLIKPETQGGVGWAKVDCIRTTKMAIRLLSSYGIQADYAIFSVVIANKTLGAYLRQHNKSVHELSKEEVRGINGAKIFRMGRLSTSEEKRSANGSWRGHMAVIVKGQVLLDLTIDSANNPDEGITSLKPFWFYISNDLIQDLKAGGGELWVTADDGERVFYRSDPDNTACLETQAWTAWYDSHDVIISEARRQFDVWRRQY